MSYSVEIDESGPWLVIEYADAITGNELVATRAEAASVNADTGVTDFILDFTDVTELVLSSESVEVIHAIDREHSEALPSGRCALVAPRDIIEIGTTFLAAVSPLKLDYRSFLARSKAEAWLRGNLPTPPPTTREKSGAPTLGTPLSQSPSGPVRHSPECGSSDRDRSCPGP